MRCVYAVGTEPRLKYDYEATNFGQMINYPRLPCTNNIAFFFSVCSCRKTIPARFLWPWPAQPRSALINQTLGSWGGVTPGPGGAPLPLYGNHVSGNVSDPLTLFFFFLLLARPR